VFDSDKEIERARYDALAILIENKIDMLSHSGAGAVVEYLREPYLVYEREITAACKPGILALEIGSGTGEFTGAALKYSAKVTTLDISLNSLKLVSLRHKNFVSQLTLVQGDMENLPFEDCSFDVVFTAGCLSYGDNRQVLSEVYRVLCQGGKFICVDSLNHNPIYKINRWCHKVMGRRSLSTLIRMPTLHTISDYEGTFNSCRVRFFGAMIWCAPLLARLIGKSCTTIMLNAFDQFFKIKSSAFKFVMVAVKNNEQSV
jgi:SAM-dependent methyltransferase